MAPRNTKKQNQAFYDNLTHAILESVSGVVSAINYVPEGRDHAAADTGHEKPSSTDIPLQIELGQMISFYHRQINGPIITKRGTFPCVTELLRMNEKRISEIKDELEDPNLTVGGQMKLIAELDKQIDYLRVNEARLSHYNMMLSAFNTAWVETFNRPWEAPKVEIPGVKTLKDMSADEAAEAKKAALEAIARVQRKAA